MTSHLPPHAGVAVFFTKYYFAAYTAHVCLKKNATIKGSLDVPLELVPQAGPDYSDTAYSDTEYPYKSSHTEAWKGACSQNAVGG